MGLYPMESMIQTPTRRLPEEQRRVEELAGKVFTPYEMDKLHTYIPGIRYVIEETELYGRIPEDEDYEAEDPMVLKLRGFVAVMYVYDLLCALMRELERRVKYATDYSLRQTSQVEMAKLLNALRGFVAVDVTNGPPRALAPPLANVYMSAIPSGVMKAIADRGLQDGDSIAEAVTDANSHTIPATSAAYVTKAAKIRVFPNVPVFTLPSIPQLLTGQLAAEGDPSLLIRLLASSQIDISLFSIQHRDRLAEVINVPAAHAQLMDYGLIDRILKVDGKYFRANDRAGVLARARAFLWGGGGGGDGGFLSQGEDAPYDAVVRTGPSYNIQIHNVVKRHLVTDVMRFSRMRNALLNRIDQWWRRQKAFNMVDGDLTDYGGDAAKFYGGLMTADALLSGHPAPCPPGSGAVFYEWNPAEGARGGKMPKVVDPYIRDWSGQMVQNPNAQFQMCSDQMGGGRMDPYTLSGGPMAPPAATWGANVLSQAYQKTKRR
eukprot:jgi/Mesvir1/28533/Mv17804-RA.1